MRHEIRSKGMKSQSLQNKNKAQKKKKKKGVSGKKNCAKVLRQQGSSEKSETASAGGAKVKGKKVATQATEVSRASSLWLGVPSTNSLHPSIQPHTCPSEDVFQVVIIPLRCAGQRSGDLMTRGTISSVPGVLWVNLLTLHHP